MTPEEERITNAVTAKLTDGIYPGARVRFKDGFYTVRKKGALEMRAGGTVVSGWVCVRDDGYTTTYSEHELEVRLV